MSEYGTRVSAKRASIREGAPDDNGSRMSTFANVA
jgi:hypothetical protein